MNKLLDAVAELVSLVSPEKIHGVSDCIRRTKAPKVAAALSSMMGTPLANNVIKQLIDDWQNTTVSSDELASMLLAASHTYTKVTSEQSVELVWTGPTTPFVSARRTEQTLLQVINAATKTLFLTSFVAYDVSSIVKALNAASDRNVDINMLLELSKEQGGSISFDAIGNMRKLVPNAKLYAWRDKASEFSNARVHAKVIVADGKSCFITSANLTDYAMERNMEAGVLISGGTIPAVLDQHLRSLVAIKVILPA